MSKGSPIIPVRIPAELLDQVNDLVAASATRSTREPWTRSAFIVHAIRAELAKRERSRTWRKMSQSKAQQTEEVQGD